MSLRANCIIRWLSEQELGNKRYISAAVALLLLVGAARIALTYRRTAQCFDAPASIAAGVEWFDRGTYTIDPIYPPMPRITIGLPLYFSGEWYPNFAADDSHGHNYNDAGNSILYRDGHHLRNLSLSRLGVLPFFLIAGILVFLWTRDEFGPLAAVMAVALFTTLLQSSRIPDLLTRTYPLLVSSLRRCMHLRSGLKRPTVCRPSGWESRSDLPPYRISPHCSSCLPVDWQFCCANGFALPRPQAHPF